MNEKDILNTFLLAGIPEIITQEEFNDVKLAIKNLMETNSKYENGEIFSDKQIKLVEKGVKIGAEVAINKEMENFVSKRKLENYLKEAQEKYEVYKRESKDNENLKPQMWIHKGEVNMLEIILDKPRKLVTLD